MTATTPGGTPRRVRRPRLLLTKIALRLLGGRRMYEFVIRHPRVDRIHERLLSRLAGREAIKVNAYMRWFQENHEHQWRNQVCTATSAGHPCKARLVDGKVDYAYHVPRTA